MHLPIVGSVRIGLCGGSFGRRPALPGAPGPPFAPRRLCRSGLGQACAVAVALFLAGARNSAAGKPPSTWVAYYSDQAQLEEFRGRNLIVFDSDRHPSLAGFDARTTTLLGYLSLGEASSQRSYFPAVKEEGILAGENTNWPGSWFVDVRDRRWHARVVHQLVPQILAAGFHGVFLDTLDDAAELERRDPVANRGMIRAAAELVRSIRKANPAIPIMMNRGYELLPEVARDIDILLGESVYSTYDFDRRTYRLVAPDAYQAQLAHLKRARKLNRALRVCTLDYWDPLDRAGIRRIYRVERGNGFDPYVATIGLDRIVGEPR